MSARYVFQQYKRHYIAKNYRLQQNKILSTINRSLNSTHLLTSCYIRFMSLELNRNLTHLLIM